MPYIPRGDASVDSSILGNDSQDRNELLSTQYYLSIHFQSLYKKKTIQLKSFTNRPSPVVGNATVIKNM